MSGGPKKLPGSLTQSVATALRGQAGRLSLSASQIARETGISQPQVSRYLRGDRAPTLEELQTICDALQMPMVDVLSEAESPIGPHLQVDPRTLLAYLIAHPDADDVLRERLREVDDQTGLNGNALATLRDEVVTLRRRELERSLGALTPSTKRAHDNSA